MGAKYYHDIRTNVTYIRHILDFKITESLNGHAELTLRGMVNQIYQNEKERILNSVTEITVGDQRPFFYGKVTDAAIVTEDQVTVLEIKAKSCSYLLDLREKQRSFQDASMTYRELFETVLSSYPGGSILDECSGGKTIPAPLLQYQETDWQFLKRLASHFNCGICQNAAGKAPALKIGAWGETKIGELEHFKYRVRKDIEGFEKLEASGCDNLLEEDAVVYELEDYSNFNLGSKAVYRGKTLYIKEKMTVMDQGILTFHYKLASQNGMAVKKRWNEAITGLSLPGAVIAVEKDQVKLHLSIDSRQDPAKAKFIPYTTVYANSGNAGWYCMPEIGDTVHMYFPSRDEAGAVAVNSLRKDDQAVQGIGTSVKIFRTAGGKELKFSEDSIKITCSNRVNRKTGEKNITFIELSDQEGIKIYSTKPVSIHSDEDLELSAGKELKLSAEHEISLACKTSQIVLNEAVDITGKVVKIN